MGDVVNIGCSTTLDIPPETILAAALEQKVEEVVVLGFSPEGEFYLASSQADFGAVLLKLEIARDHIVRMARGHE